MCHIKSLWPFNAALRIWRLFCRFVIGWRWPGKGENSKQPSGTDGFIQEVREECLRADAASRQETKRAEGPAAEGWSRRCPRRPQEAQHDVAHRVKGAFCLLYEAVTHHERGLRCRGLANINCRKTQYRYFENMSEMFFSDWKTKMFENYLKNLKTANWWLHSYRLEITVRNTVLHKSSWNITI